MIEQEIESTMEESSFWTRSTGNALELKLALKHHGKLPFTFIKPHLTVYVRPETSRSKELILELRLRFNQASESKSLRKVAK